MSNTALNGIFQALDAQNYKNALKLCNAALKKKENAFVTVLKAISMSKLGEIDEAIRVCDTVAFQGHSDEHIISNLNYFYRSVNQLDKMCKIWSILHQKSPKEEKYAEGAFLSYAKVKNLKSQQELAITLNKSFPSKKHSFWYIMTLMSLANDNPSSTIQLQLSLKLAEKLAAEGKFENSEDLYVYQSILEKLNKDKEHLELMNGKLGELYNVPTERLKIQANLNVKLNLFKESAECFKKIITTYERDEWSCFIGYFDSIEKIEGQKVNYQELKQWITQELQQKDNPKPLRAPFIAELEIYKRYSDNKDKQQWFDGIVELVMSYFTRFGTKPICFYDLKKYLQLLDTYTIQQRQSIIEKMLEVTSKEKKTTARISQLSNIYRFQRVMGLQTVESMDKAKAQQLVNDLLQEYEESAQLNPIAEKSERNPGDDLVLISYYLLADRELNVEAAMVLEYGLTVSPKNFQFNIGLIRLYQKLGAYGKVVENTKSLSIKNIQWDSIGYLVLDDMIASAGSVIEELKSSFDKAQRFYSENDSTPDFVATSYSQETYSKIWEIQKFLDRVANSYHRQANATEIIFVKLMESLIVPPNNHPAQTLHETLKSVASNTFELGLKPLPQEQIAKFTFNQDLQVEDRWNPTNQPECGGWRNVNDIVSPTSLSFEGREKDHEQLVNLLNMRRSILGCLVNSLITVTPSVTPQTPAQITFKSTTQEYEQELNNLIQLLEKLGYKASSTTTTVESLQQFNQMLLQSIPMIFKVFIQVRDNSKQSSKEQVEIITKLITQLINQLNELTKYLTSDKLQINGLGIRAFNKYFEFMKWNGYLMNEIGKVLPNKKSKKSDENSLAIREEFEKLFNQCNTNNSAIETKLLSIKLNAINLDDSSKHSLPAFVTKLNVEPKINQSIQESVKSISKYIVPLKL